MNFKPDEALLMAYLYGELQGEEKVNVENYLAEHPEVVRELEALNHVRSIMARVTDKEVIAPPIVLDHQRKQYFWSTSFGKTMLGFAASLTLIMLVGKFTGLHISVKDKALTIGFGDDSDLGSEKSAPDQPLLTSYDVQLMINQSMARNNESLAAQWSESQQKLDESIKKNLASYSDGQFNTIMKKVSTASDEQIRQFALSLQADNAKMIKDYMTLNSSDQRKYMEELLIDFARYLEQQNRSDLQVLQARLNSIEQNTDLFKYETEQILTSIISSVDNSKSLATKN